MEFVMTLKVGDMTVSLECPDVPDLTKLQPIFNSLTTKAIEEIKPTVKRGRGRPRKGEKK